MQLVPILSTIILVGTIATFILAVAAYVLYKIRERRAHEDGAVQTQYVQEPHVLVTPQQTTLAAPAQQQQAAPSTNVFVAPSQPAPSQQQQQAQTQPRPALQAQPAEPQNSLFWEYTDEGFVPVQPEDAGHKAQQQDEDEQDGFAWL
jgi:Na+-transporting NADH:ubiquinone oxidoreductase subunit NqrC